LCKYEIFIFGKTAYKEVNMKQHENREEFSAELASFEHSPRTASHKRIKKQILPPVESKTDEKRTQI